MLFTETERNDFTETEFILVARAQMAGVESEQMQELISFWQKKRELFLARSLNHGG